MVPLPALLLSSLRWLVLSLGAAMRRREFIKGMVGSAAAIWSPAVLAQQTEKVRRIGVLMHSPSNEPEAQARLAAFLQGMRDAGWEVGRNLRIEYRWSVGGTARLFSDAKELVALNPDAILAGVGGTAVALHQATRVIPIVPRLFVHSVALAPFASFLDRREREYRHKFPCVRTWSNTNRRIAEDRLPARRPLSIFVTTSDSVTCCVSAMSFRLLQKASSRLTLVLCPSMTTERLTTSDFIMETSQKIFRRLSPFDVMRSSDKYRLLKNILVAVSRHYSSAAKMKRDQEVVT